MYSYIYPQHVKGNFRKFAMLNVFRDGQGLPVNPVTANTVGNFNLNNWCGNSFHGPVFVSVLLKVPLSRTFFTKVS